jgi:hypothetical protein
VVVWQPWASASFELGSVSVVECPSIVHNLTASGCKKARRLRYIIMLDVGKHIVKSYKQKGKGKGKLFLCESISFNLKKKAAGSTETLVNSTRLHNCQRHGTFRS